MKRIVKLVPLLFCLILPSAGAYAYSLVTHEQLIDLTWKDSIVPLLLSRYPNLTQAELERARAYAYGGCVIQDIGYYPFGDLGFSNLTHYVRSGDFVVSLLRNAQNANELAFAIGALSHYVGDTVGHSEATNLAVPVEFPKLRAKYGPVVNYAEGESQHVQTEFAFDINEVAHHRVAPVHYLRHIGLDVPVKLLALSFYQTYGTNEDFTGRRGRRINVRAYRFAVRDLIPRIAYATTLLHRNHEPADPTTADAVEIERQAAAVDTENNWQAYRRKAGIGTYALAAVLFVMPKVGPLKLVAVKGPTEATEAEYMHSLAVSAAALRRSLARFTPPDPSLDNCQPGVLGRSSPGEEQALIPGAAKDSTADLHHPLPNRDLDTGHVVEPGGYPLTDSTYARLLHVLTRQPGRPIPPGIKQDIQTYYSNPDAPITTKKDPRLWAEVQADLATLSAMETSAEPDLYPTYEPNAGCPVASNAATTADREDSETSGADSGIAPPALGIG